MRIHRYLRLFALSIVIAAYLTIYTTFLIGLQVPERQVLVQMNEVGEYWVELILLTLAFPFVCVLFLDYLEKVAQEHRQRLARERGAYE